MSREYTNEEIQQNFIAEIKKYVNYWATQPQLSVQEQCDGVAFSILNILDGTSELPGFIVAPCPHESDKNYHIKNNDNYYPEFEDTNQDISGNLHELYYRSN